MGITNPRIPPAPYADQPCAVVSFYTAARTDRSSFTDFQKDAKTARPIVRTFLFATGLAEAIGGPRGNALADQLAARPLGEQMLRMASTWGEGEAKAAPPLPPGVKAIVVAELGAAISERDHANTEWLKVIVAKNGWPLRSSLPAWC